MGWKRTKGISAAQRDEETRRKPLLTRNSVVIIIYSFFEYRAQDSESGHWSGFGAEKKKKKKRLCLLSVLLSNNEWK